MNRKDYEFAKKAARTAYQQALLDAGGGGGVSQGPHIHPHFHSYDGETTFWLKEAGNWIYRSTWALGDDGFGLNIAYNFTRPDNILIMKMTDTEGKRHTFDWVAVGDFLQITQDENNHATYKITLVSVDEEWKGGEVVLHLDQGNGKGAPTQGEKSFVRIEGVVK